MLSILWKVGAITKSVRKNAIPTRIWFGGIVGVPSAFRTKPSTIRIRVKPVTASSTPGITVSSDSRTRIWTGVRGAVRRDRRSRRRESSSDRPARAAR